MTRIDDIADQFQLTQGNDRFLFFDICLYDNQRKIIFMSDNDQDYLEQRELLIGATSQSTSPQFSKKCTIVTEHI